MRKITLIVDDEWYKAIDNLTTDVYDGETCKWVAVKEMPTVREMDGVSQFVLARQCACLMQYITVATKPINEKEYND